MDTPRNTRPLKTQEEVEAKIPYWVIYDPETEWAEIAFNTREDCDAQIAIWQASPEKYGRASEFYAAAIPRFVPKEIASFDDYLHIKELRERRLAS